MGIETERIEEYLRVLNIGRAYLDEARGDGAAEGEDINECVLCLAKLSDEMKHDIIEGV
jgi:hypothetical protein